MRPARRHPICAYQALVLLTAVASACGPAGAQDTAPVKVRAEGSAMGTTFRARDQAVLNAKKQAVSLWLESLLGRPPSDVFDPLLDQCDYYVQSFRIVDLQPREGAAHVQIEAYLHPWALKADAATILFRERRQPPRVVVLVVEERVDQGTRRFQSDARIAQAVVDVLGDRDFDVVSPDAVRRRYSDRELLGLLNAGAAALARCAREHRADALVLIQSTLDVRPNTEGVGPLRARAELELSVVGARSPQLYEHAETAAEVNCLTVDEGLTFALDDALFKLRDRLIVGAVLAASPANASSAFELTLKEAPTWQAVERVGDHLRSHPGVQQVEVLTAQPGFGLIQFDYSGNIGELVRSLESADLLGYRLEARAVVDRDMEFRFVAR